MSIVRRWLRENRALIALLLCLGLVRTALADWNPIPSGSMRPTLLEGDVVLVNRVAYDLKLPFTNVILAHTGEPRRGDVVTFFSPANGERLIKRLVGLPGDVIEMREEQLVINGEPLGYQPAGSADEPLRGGHTPALRATEGLAGHPHVVQVLPRVAAMRDWGPVRVPQGSYFFLGDNRDDSGDSRYFGAVPRALLIGRAHHVLASADILGHWQPRFARFGARIG